ncbi:MAG TPA: hypothetical protein VMC48_03905 [Methanobacterium sp.]|nr:hypothetical protein [Methanobacterium sp.]
MLYSICKVKKLKKDSVGQIFSIDLLFALVILAVVLGMSANAIDIAGNKISDYSAGRSMDRIATDTADVLINTPGPQDWEKSNNTLMVKPGLAIDSNSSVNSTKILSYKKINQLKSRYMELMSNFIPPPGNSYLSIEPTNPSLKEIEVSNETPPAKVSEVAVVNRTVLVSYRDFNIITIIDKSSQLDVCPHYSFNGTSVHNKPNNLNKSSGWICKSFKVTKRDLNSTDFYILTDPGVLNGNQAHWILDRPDSYTEEQEPFSSHPIMINDRISALMGEDNEAVFWLHVFISSDPSGAFVTYVVGVPHGTSSEEVRVEYLNPQPCFLILKVWME